MHIHIGVLQWVTILLLLPLVNIPMRLIALHLRNSRIGQAIGFAY